MHIEMFEHSLNILHLIDRDGLSLTVSSNLKINKIIDFTKVYNIKMRINSSFNLHYRREIRGCYCHINMYDNQNEDITFSMKA